MKQDKKIYYPLFASRSLNGGEQDQVEHKKVVEQLALLNSEKRLSLMSDNMAAAIAVLDNQFQLPEKFIEYITVLVREMFFGNITEQDILRVLRQELVKFPSIQADTLIQHVQLNIFRAQPDADEPEEDEDLEVSENDALPQENVRQYTLLDALSKYPYIGNQPITTDTIKLKSQVALVRPTLTNWLKNYRDELGIGMHDAVARAKFLFESQNTKKLPSIERDRIHTLVRSLEDNELLNIDTKKEVILFSNQVKEKESVTTKPQNDAANTEAATDIFERFQNVNTVPVDNRTQLGGVGTQTFGGGKIPAGESPTDETAILSRIKNMFVITPKANAPAPPEDFAVTAPKVAESLQVPSPQEPLGTLRFSAKHVLPAERQNLQPAIMPIRASSMDSRIEHFRPQEVVIPESTPQAFRATVPQQPVPESMKIASPPIQTPTSTAIPSSSSPVYVNPVPPAVKETLEEPTSMFRIKPSRD